MAIEPAASWTLSALAIATGVKFAGTSSMTDTVHALAGAVAVLPSASVAVTSALKSIVVWLESFAPGG